MRCDVAGLFFLCLGLFIFQGCVDYSPIDLDGGKDCIPDCTGKCCGGDGCGGKCQDNCSDGYTCNHSTCECERNAECRSNMDCPEGFWCDRTVFRCREIECIPNCTGRCCGSDGCEGTCPDNCPAGYRCSPVTCMCETSGCHTNTDCTVTQCCVNWVCVYMNCGNLECGPDPVCGRECGPCPVGQDCVNGTCAFVEPLRPGDPCSFGDVNEAAGDCGAGLVCLGVPADGNAGTCAGGSATECNQLLDEWNPDCVNGNCGVSFCAQECGVNRTCPAGFTGMDVGDPPFCYCIPSPVNGHSPGEPCPFGNVNTEHDDCTSGMVCLGSEDVGSCLNGSPAECTGVPDRWNIDCVNGVCGFSFCSAECDAQDNCPQEFYPTYVSGTCFCIPEPGGSGQPGDPCPFSDINYNYDFCASGLQCLGIPADGNSGTCPGGSATECTDIPESQNPDCVNGLCGLSFCSEQCDAQGNCPAGFVPQDVGGTCYCIPA